jgi:hypothetical protein
MTRRSGDLLKTGSFWRALLVLFLFSDVGEDEAPTRIRVGSHLDVRGILEPAGDAGLSFTPLVLKLSRQSNRQLQRRD